MRPHGVATSASLFTSSLYFTKGVTREVPPGIPLQYASTAPGVAVTNGTKLRILPAGDSITVGWLGDDHNSYRKQLQSDLSGKLRSISSSHITYYQLVADLVCVP